MKITEQKESLMMSLGRFASWVIGLGLVVASYWAIGHLAEFVNIQVAKSSESISPDYMALIWLYAAAFLFDILAYLSFALIGFGVKDMKLAVVLFSAILFFSVGLINALRFLKQMGIVANMENESSGYIFCFSLLVCLVGFLVFLFAHRKFKDE